MKKWVWSLSALLLVLVPQISLAEGYFSWFHFGPPSTDVSLTYLCKIFGTVSGALTCQGSTATVFF